MEKTQNSKYDTKLKLIWHFLLGARRYFLLSLIFATLVSLFDMINPKIISYTVDGVIGTTTPEVPAIIHQLVAWVGGIPALKEHLWWVAIAVAAVGVLAGVSRYIFRVCNSRGAETLVERMRNELFRHIMYLPYTWHSENSTGDIIQRCTSDVQTIKRFVSEQLVALCRTVIMIAMALTFMAGIHWKVMLGTALMIPIIVAYSLMFHRKIGSAFQKVDQEEGVLSAIVQENLTGVRVVRAFGREDYERQRFDKQNVYYTGFWIHLMKLMSAFWSTADILTGLQLLLVILLGSIACTRGTLSVGGFIAMASYNTMLIWPVRQLGRVIAQMSKAGVSIERIRYIMNSAAEAERENVQEPPIDRDIVFENVSYSYENGSSEVLHNIDMTIPAGSTIGILGGTGSGKSTLMYLLERLYDLPEGNGRITIGGVDIADIRRGWLRSNIGMVLQEPYLFSRTLSENIAIAGGSAVTGGNTKGVSTDRKSISAMKTADKGNAGKTVFDMEAIRQAAREASIDDAIESFTAGYDTFVGERGVTLSGGQKQRTAIAQMLIRKTPVMVFDDSLSAVDAETDMKIRHAIRENTGSSTIILIAHRITTLMNADRPLSMT